METEERQQVSVMLGSVSSLSTFLAKPENVRRIYQGLNDRSRLIGALLDRSNSQRGLPTLNEVDRLIRIRDWEPILVDVQTWALAYCFTQAVKLHVDDRPFGAPDVAKIWREASERTKAEVQKQTGQQTLDAAYCSFCDGGGWKYKDKNGDDVEWKDRGAGIAMTRCHCRG